MKSKAGCGTEALFWDCATQGDEVPIRSGVSRCWFVQAATGNVTITVSSGLLEPGTEIEVVFRQDAVGGRTLTIGGSGGPIIVGGGSSAPALGARESSVYRFRGIPTNRVAISKQIV